MNCANFEDTIFILNMRIRTIRDTLRLNPSAGLFMEKSLDDLAFVDHTLSILAGALIDEQSGGTDEFSYASDTEWQFSQLLTEFALDSSPFPARSFPEIADKIAVLRDSSNTRRKALDESAVANELLSSEPVVSSAELCGLLGVS